MITFSKSLSITQVLNAFNNNVTEFTSDTVGTLDRAEITISGNTITITPDVNGVFRYNLKKIFSTLINQNNFSDPIEEFLTDPPQYVQNDTTLFLETQVDFKVIFDNDDEETISKTYKITKSVIQTEDFRKDLSNQYNSSISILLPFTQASRLSYHATYHVGYPFDFSLYSDTARQITMTNVKSQDSMIFSAVKGVNRIFWSVGGTDWTLEDELPLQDGVNELELTFAGQPSSQKLTFYLTKVREACGTHLKWFNNAGGWSYFLFRELDQFRNVKSLGEFVQDFGNIDDAALTRSSLGSEQNDTLNLFAVGLDTNQKQHLDTITGSPKMYRYLDENFQVMSSGDWISEGVKDGSFRQSKANKSLYEFKVTVKKNARNTFTL